MHSTTAPASLSLIVAISENRVIGKENKLPWHLPDEWDYFRKVTGSKAFLMGRKSYESPDALFSPYRNVVVSTSTELLLSPRTELANSLTEALEILAEEPEVFVLGGVQIYRQLLPFVSRLYITTVHAEIEGDAYFPEVDWSAWRQVYTQYHPADDQHTHAFTMKQYIRTNAESIDLDEVSEVEK